MLHELANLDEPFLINTVQFNLFSKYICHPSVLNTTAKNMGRGRVYLFTQNVQVTDSCNALLICGSMAREFK